MKENLKVGLLGLGNMGRNHLRVLSMLKGVDLVFIYDVDQEATKRHAQVSGARALANVEEGLGDVDAVMRALSLFVRVKSMLMTPADLSMMFFRPCTAGLYRSMKPTWTLSCCLSEKSARRWASARLCAMGFSTKMFFTLEAT